MPVPGGWGKGGTPMPLHLGGTPMPLHLGGTPMPLHLRGEGDSAGLLE